MKRTRLHLFASRLHKWLALFAGLQIILWFASGAYMSFMPIKEVRGEHLIDRHASRPLPANINLSGLTATLARYPAAHSVELLSANGQSFALLHIGHDKVVRVDTASDAIMPPLDANATTRLALEAWTGPKPSVLKAQLLKTEPGDYRGDLPVWQIEFADPENTRAYVSPDSGKILAVRTDSWRTFDLMWGLHIMDWNARENINSPWLFGFAVAALILALAGLVLLLKRWPFRRRKRPMAI
ncbi:MAG: PepSY domain-containing protein [Sphingorhabdus sp.]